MAGATTVWEPTTRFTDRTARAAKDEKGKPLKDKDGKTIYEEEQRSRPIYKQYTVFNVKQADTTGLPRTRWCSRSRPNFPRATATTKRRFTSAAIRPATRIAWIVTCSRRVSMKVLGRRSTPA